MKKVFVTIVVSVICALGICYIEFNVCKLVSIKNESKELLEKAYEIVESPTLDAQNKNIIQGSLISNQENKQVKNNEGIENSENKDIIGVILIPKLNIEAPIKEGTSQKIMKTSVGHFTESDYWNGNVSLASHNSGTSAHYFGKINLLNENDEIIYKTRLGTKKYKVQSVDKIKSTDWSKVVGTTTTGTDAENTITLVTCINMQPNFRLCVRGVEVSD